MLNSEKLTRYYDRLGLSTQARLVIDNIRASPPARRVDSAVTNVAVRYPSKKMGAIIQAESHKNELAAIYEFEFDDAVLEYYDQPSRFKLIYRTKKGKKVGVMHTPDFFVMGVDASYWVECKTEEELEKLAEEKPKRYYNDETGRWRSPPGERYALQYGLDYRVRSSAETNWLFHRNAIFLDDYFRADDWQVEPEAVAEIRQLVTHEPGMTLKDLLAGIQKAGSDDIYNLIVSEQIYVDLNAAALAEPDAVNVFPDRWTARAHVIILDTLSQETAGGFQSIQLQINELVTWSKRAWRIINVGETETWLRLEGDTGDRRMVKFSHAEFQALVEAGEVGGANPWIETEMSAEADELLAKASPEDLAEANRRYWIIKSGLTGQTAANKVVSKRTIRRWVASFKQAEQVHRCGYIGLLRQYHRCGNHQPKLPLESRVLMDKFIEEEYEHFKQKHKLAVHGKLERECAARGIHAPSYKTFAQAIKGRPQKEQERKRRGRRVANQHEPFYWELEYTTPRHGERPYEIGHLDHTELDLELLHSYTGKNLGKAWVTFLTDAFTRELLAFYLSYESPSYRSCMMVLRECVRRHGRLPQFLVVDGGAEFESIFFETLLARYECAKKSRPKSKPRYGSVVERLFGTTHTQFIYNLLGNTQIAKKVRQMSKELDPKKLANWTLPRLYVRLREWAYEIYSNTEHPVLGQSPYETRTMGLVQSGARPQRMIRYDQTFIIETMPSPRKGTAKVDPNQGVKINYIYYWCDLFRHAQVRNSQVPVRYDPNNMGVAYAFVQGRWRQCISEHYARLQGRSEVIIKLAAQELRAQNRRQARRVTITARRIAAFVETLEKEEEYWEQFWRDAENQQVIALTEGRQSSKNISPGPNSVSAEDARSPETPAQANDTTDDDDIEAYPVLAIGGGTE